MFFAPVFKTRRRIFGWFSLAFCLLCGKIFLNRVYLGRDAKMEAETDRWTRLPRPTEKECSKCGKVLPVSEFQTRNGKSRGRICNACSRDLSRKVMRRRKLWSNNEIRSLLMGPDARCCICGFHRFMVSLEFHHVNRNLKDSSISRLVGVFSYSGRPETWSALVAEVRKCVILCANCHRALHVGEVDLPRGFLYLSPPSDPPQV